MIEENKKWPYFRPGIVIFVRTDSKSEKDHEKSKDIYEYFLSIINSIGMAESLLGSIGIITIPSETTDVANATLQADYWTINPMSFSPNEIKVLTKQSTASLKDILEKVPQQITYSGRLDNIRSNNYNIADSRPQIFIVGNPSNPIMGEILQQVRMIPDLSPSKVYYILSSDCVAEITSGASTVPPPTNKQRLAPDFCFVYEPYAADPHWGYSKPGQQYYAAAQALYTLLTTGITEYTEMEQTIASTVKQNSDIRFGTLSTCLITTSDRVARAAQEFYEGYLINQLTNWREKVDQLPPDLEQNMENIKKNWNNTNLTSMFDLKENDINQILTIVNQTYRKNHTKFDAQEWLKELDKEISKRFFTNSNVDENSSHLSKLLVPIKENRNSPYNQSTRSSYGPIAVLQYLDKVDEFLNEQLKLFSPNSSVQQSYEKKIQEVIKSLSFSIDNSTEPKVYTDDYIKNLKSLYIQQLQQLYKQIPAWRPRIAISILVVVIVLFMSFTPSIPVFTWATLVAIIIIYIVVANLFYASYHARNFRHNAEPIYKALITVCNSSLLYSYQQQAIIDLKNAVTSKLKRCEDIIKCSSQIGQKNEEDQLQQAKNAFFSKLETLHNVYLTKEGLRLEEISSSRDDQTRSLEDFANNLRAETLNQWNDFLSLWMEDTSKAIDEKTAEERAKEIIKAKIANLQQTNVSIIANSHPLWDYISQSRLRKQYTRFWRKQQPSFVFLYGGRFNLEKYRQYLQESFKKVDIIVSDTEGKNVTDILVAAFYSDVIPPASIDYDALFPISSTTKDSLK